MIGEKSADFKDTLKDKINDFVDGIMDQYENAKDEAGKMIEEGKGKLSSAKSKAKQSYS